MVEDAVGGGNTEGYQMTKAVGVVALLAMGCSGGLSMTDGGDPADGATSDADIRLEDGGAIDAGATDAGANDAGANDGGATDAGTSDAGSDPDPIVPSDHLVLVPTFHNIGVYWNPNDVRAGDVARCEYRAAGGPWRATLDLWLDERTSDIPRELWMQFRGSVVELEAGTPYDVRCTNDRTGVTEANTTETWSETFPVASTIPVGARSTRLTIDEGGRADGYVVYDGGTIDARGLDRAIQVNASYVILRNLEIANAARHGIFVAPGVHDVVIEGCDIHGWGRIAPDGFGCNRDSAIYVDGRGDLGTERIIIQRNRLHDPRGDSNSSDEDREGSSDCSNADSTSDGYAHPQGPQAISIQRAGGRHVIRFNDIYSDDRHRLNDAIGGGQNFSYAGTPNRDSDIYGNRITHAWDNLIEAEGANVNVRIYRNQLDRGFGNIGIAPVSVGPLYIFRNVNYRARRSASRSGGQFLKNESEVFRPEGVFYGGGRVYVFHNTNYGVPLDADTCPRGIDGLRKQLLEFVTRNNIWEVTDVPIFDFDHPDGTFELRSDFDWDLYNREQSSRVLGQGHYRHGILATPSYEGSWADGDLRLVPGSRGHDEGVRIPNFNDGYAGAAPDMGALESGRDVPRYGVEAP
ncbi:MAG: hypothetical protein R3B82_20350 [Sandaracinaceae bacterium]